MLYIRPGRTCSEKYQMEVPLRDISDISVQQQQQQVDAIMYPSLKPYLTPGTMDSHCFCPINIHSLSSDFPQGLSPQQRAGLAMVLLGQPGLCPLGICTLS